MKVKNILIIFVESLNECKSFQIKEENQPESNKKKEIESQKSIKNNKSQTTTKENLTTRNPIKKKTSKIFFNKNE